MKAKDIQFKIKPKQTRQKMSKGELARYMDTVKKSSHRFRDRKKFYKGNRNKRGGDDLCSM